MGGFDQGWALGARSYGNEVARSEAWSDAQRRQAIADNQSASLNIASVLRTGKHPDTGAALTPAEITALTQKHKELMAQSADLWNLRQRVDRMGKAESAASGVPMPEGVIHKLTDKLHLTKPPAPGAPQTIDATVPAMTLPGQPTVPAGPQRTVQGPPRSPAQQMSDLREITQRYQTSEPNLDLQLEQNLIAAGFSTDDAKRAVAVRNGIEAKPVADKATTWKKNGNPVEIGGKVMQPEINAAGEMRIVEAPEGMKVPDQKQSQYQSQRTAFAKTLGKEPGQMDWNDERAFLTQRYGANQPLAAKRVDIAQENERIQAASLALRQSSNDMKDFMSIQKALSPMEKLQTTAERADYYVANHSGPGDAALTLAFADAIKPSSGFRFTDTERKWLTTESRGIVDGALARINSGFTGEVLAPDQRQNMAAIIKEAASQANTQRAQLLGATSELNPKASRLAGSAQGSPRPGPAAKSFSVTAPDGRVYTFPNKLAADRFRAEAGIK